MNPIQVARQGGKATEFKADGAAKPAAAAAPAAAAPAEAPKPAATAPAKPALGGNLFAELSKGGEITSGLKKVTRDMTNKDKKVESVVSRCTSTRASS